MKRDAVMAGKFYESDPLNLWSQVKDLLSDNKEIYDAFGCVSPHAGYMYSGRVAASTLQSMKPKDTYVILGPNHTGVGCRYSIDTKRTWSNPLGNISADTDLAESILKKCALITDDTSSHDYEHSIEVQLPFLQVMNGNEFQIVPIVVGGSSLKDFKAIGKAISDSIKEQSKSVSIIASSDMTHYESHEQAEFKDKNVIDKILRLDETAFLNHVIEKDVTMCGYGPTAIMLCACRALGATKAKVINYQTSGETSGDYSSVVGYAGVVVY